MRTSKIVALGLLLAANAAAARAADTLVVCTEASPDALNAQLSTANTSFDVSEQIADRLVAAGATQASAAAASAAPDAVWRARRLSWLDDMTYLLFDGFWCCQRTPALRASAAVITSAPGLGTAGAHVCLGTGSVGPKRPRAYDPWVSIS